MALKQLILKHLQLRQQSIKQSDVYEIDSIFMAADFSTAADSDDTDVTDRFNLDTGQRDNFYDMGRIVRKKVLLHRLVDY